MSSVDPLRNNAPGGRPDSPWYIAGAPSRDVRVFDPAEAHRKMRELVGSAAAMRPRKASAGTIELLPDDYEEADEDPTAHLSHEDTRRFRMLSRLARDDNGGRRPALVATEGQVQAIAALRDEAPHVGVALGVVEAAARLSLRLGRPLAVPPVLLLGAPGLGKTFVAKRLAELLGSSFHMFAMNAAPSMFMLAGLATAWRGASPGRISTMLVDGATASPVAVYDEIDKAMSLTPTDRPYDLLHSLFERENASRFVDDFYEIGFDVSHMISIATANAVDHLPASLLDRLLILRVETPTRDERREMAIRVFVRTAERMGLDPDARPFADVFDMLADFSPRRITRMLAIAMPVAAAAGRERLIVDDVRHARTLLDAWSLADRREPMGFVVGRP